MGFRIQPKENISDPHEGSAESLKRIKSSGTSGPPVMSVEFGLERKTMADQLTRYRTKSYLWNLGWALALVMLANAFIFFANRAEEGPTPRVGLAPPGYVIGMIWVLLFVAMSTSRWLSLRADDLKAARLVGALIVICAIYPLYTLALSNLVLGLLGNVTTGILALVTAMVVYRRSRLGGSLLLLVVAWLSFATYLIAEQMKGSAL